MDNNEKLQQQDKYEAFIGKILDGRYRILELVGVGGMAVVLKAEDLVMNRVVAIKILNERYNGDEQAEKRFINESKAVAMLSNKNIVNIYDVAIYPDIKYIVMEYLDGITLRSYMDCKKALPWKEACVYTLQILRALEHAHGKNVIHRDIKPQNIILLKDGEVKVTDFGIAKTPDSSESYTEDNKAIGTVYYISPEQASGSVTTYASDIYSVGVMLYEQVTGELPFVADSPVTVAMMQINDAPKDVKELNPDVPYGVVQIINKAMAKQPEERFADAHTMLKAIDYVIKNPDAVFTDDLKEERTGDGDNDRKVNYSLINTGDLTDYVISVENEEKKENQDIKSKKERLLVKPKKERTSHSIFPVITGVFIAFMIVATVVAGYLAVKWVPSLFETVEKEDFLVRDFINEIYSPSMKAELEKEGYMVTVKEVYNQGLGFNVIVDQEPKTGRKLYADGICRITLSVNKYPDDLTVPNVKYMTASEAEKVLKQYNLYAVTEYVSDAYANDKQVVSTNPAIGSYVAAGAKVTIYVCRGAGVTQAKTMPNVIGLDLNNAKKQLEDSYYLVNVNYIDSEKPDGTVLEQDIPPFTTGLSAWTSVNITVSRYTEMLKVEDYYGMTLEEAKAKINSNGFVVGSIKYNDKSFVPAGRIISQSIPSNTAAAVGTVIDLVISGTGLEIASPVPDVLNNNIQQATQKLTLAGYSVNVVRSPSVNPENTVIKQSIAPGATGYPTGTIIELTVSIPIDSILIEDYTGYTISRLLEAFENCGIVLGSITFTLEGEGEEYCVIGQTVAPGEYISPNDNAVGITLFGSECFAQSAPRVIGMTVEGASRMFRNAWYTVVVVNEISKEPTGTVIRQSVQPDTSNNPIGTVVTLTVSVEKTTTMMPNLLGMTIEEAEAALESVDLVLNDISFRQSTEKDGIVIEQSLEWGEEVPIGTKVNIVLCEHIDS